MIVTVDSKTLKGVFVDTLKGKRVMMNFKCDGNTLYVEVLKDYTLMKRIPCVSVDGDYNQVDCSFYATKVLQCIDDSERLTIIFTPASVILQQEVYNCTLIKEYEARREYDIAIPKLEKANIQRLKYLVMMASKMGKIAKEIKVIESDPIISNGTFYVKYFNTVFSDSMDYPESCFALNALKDFVFLLDENTEYAYIEDKNMFYFKSKNYEIWIPTLTYNIKTNEIIAVEKEYAKCRKVAEVSINQHINNFSIMASAFSGESIYLTFGENTVSANVQAVSANFMIGDKVDKVVLTMSITPAQLDFICQVFGEDDKIVIKKGGNCLCLETKKKRLLISGVAY